MRRRGLLLWRHDRLRALLIGGWWPCRTAVGWLRRRRLFYSVPVTSLLSASEAVGELSSARADDSIDCVLTEPDGHRRRPAAEITRSELLEGLDAAPSAAPAALIGVVAHEAAPDCFVETGGQLAPLNPAHAA